MAGVRRRAWHYRPGEVVVAVELPGGSNEQRQAHAVVRRAIEHHLAGRAGGVFRDAQRRSEPIIFRAPDRPALAFLFYDLAEAAAHAPVKQVVSAVHADNLAALEPVRRAGIAPVGVMPHWLGSAQSNYSDGSPASLPRPTRPPGDGRWRHRYTPRDRGLDLRPRVGRVPARALVPVLVLDTGPDWAHARRQAARFANTNGQVSGLVDALAAHPLADWHTAAMRTLCAEGLKLARAPDGRTRSHDMADHGLFVAGLIHDLAPRADVHLRPVLNQYGVGDLHLLLCVLQEVIANKPVAQPVVLNMSLGFLPKVEHLPWLWYEVNHPHDPELVAGEPRPGESRDGRRPDEPRDARWLAQNRAEVERTTRLLHEPVGRLTAYLLANNCLGVAAAGNDSLRRVATGRPRLGPRVPARYESVLGVAATTQDPASAARYSNIGDELELGDHIATFGGDVTDTDEPRDGVIGVYTAATFPTAARGPGAPKLANETGWAAWSGTSFATAIASGVVATYWAAERARQPNLHAEDVLRNFNTLARSYAPSLRTPSIGITGEWQRC